MSYKIPRLEGRIKQRAAQVIQTELADPRIGLITITSVRLSRDLTRCVILYSVLGGDGEKSRCAHALEDGRGYIQREVARILRTRTTPHLEFQYDPSIEGSIRISSLLREVLGPEAESTAEADAAEEGEDDADVEHDSDTEADRG